jgi:methylglutaconyl-CoA hydratase
MAYQFLSVLRDGPIERLSLNRPDVRNAFNEHLIAELSDWAIHRRQLGSADGVRVIVLAGEGKAFCAGADVAWMSKMVTYSEAENIRDATAVANMFGLLDTLPVPVVGRVHGAALGGGAGLCAICDIVVAGEETIFGFTEVKLGILPATIAPFVLTKIGPGAARELFLTGARFSAARAREIGLVHAAVPSAEIDASVGRFTAELLESGPEAVAAAKQLIREIYGRPPANVVSLTAETLARRRVSSEGQDGLRAFLEKRKASWNA